MVQAGQFLERPTLIDSRGATLEGLWHRGDRRPAVLICPPHPSRGSSMDSAVCAELAFAAARAGHPTLRFNYRGAGASQGKLDGARESWVEDAAAALEVLRHNVGGDDPVAVVGYDAGAEVALELARAGAPLSVVALVAPRTGDYEFGQLAQVEVPVLVVAAQRDPLTDRPALAELCQGRGDQLVVIPGADHAFSRGLQQLGHVVAAFLRGERADVDA